MLKDMPVLGAVGGLDTIWTPFGLELKEAL